MQSHKVEWRELTVKEFDDWLRNGFEEDKPFPYETWLVAVDGVPIAEVDAKTRLAILPEVYDFLGVLHNTWIAYFSRRTSDDGNSSSASMPDTTKSCTET